jgi:hypothetical protein
MTGIDGVMCIAPKKYIEKMMASYEQFFGTTPSQKFTSPLEKGNHPETNDSKFLDSMGMQQYQSLIGAMQWAVSIGRLDITTAIMTLSSFRAMPQRGHLDCVKRVYGYLSKMKEGIIHVHTDKLDYSGLAEQDLDWTASVYGNVSKILPTDAPTLLGKYVTLTHYFDANLFHGMLTGRSITGLLHLLNKTPNDWYSKKQATVETATYGSEFIATRTCVDQVIDHHTSICYLGVLICDKSFVS